MKQKDNPLLEIQNNCHNIVLKVIVQVTLCTYGVYKKDEMTHENLKEKLY